MAKNRKTPNMNFPVWFDGQNINEALFCEEFLHERRIIFANGAFFTPDGRVTDDLPLRGEIKKIVFNFPVPVDGEKVKELPLETETTVETVCLLSKHNAKHHIEVGLNLDELDLTNAEKTAT